MGKFPCFKHYVNKNYEDYKDVIDSIFKNFCKNVGKYSVKQVITKNNTLTNNIRHLEVSDYFILSIIVDDNNIIEKIYIN